ncbi:MAG: penicillin-binding protein 1A, partial [Alphaproteobacteria bacterium]|nr:penicillin-binding protein 1A [Alphaproteobacteria bacterium]
MAALLIAVGTLGLVVGLYLFWHYGRDLPDHKQLADYQPAIVTRVHTGDGRLVAEFATERRVFVPVSEVPQRVVDAFLASEDSEFYSHPGVNVFSIARAAFQNLTNVAADRRPKGASTITQQVAKNFLLTNEVSLSRKVKEAILAMRIEKALSKDRILELYLNEIYLGYGSYGVAAAAVNYFGKALDELSVAEAAYLAALPKAPNNYHPVRQPQAAVARRNWVLERMREERFITAPEFKEYTEVPLVTRARNEDVVKADYFAEEVRRQLQARFGDEALYRGGLVVRTSLDPRLQAIAERVFRQGLRAYDRRHGWRGPIARNLTGADWAKRLADVPPPAGLDPWRLSVVLQVAADHVDIGFADGGRGQIALADMTWARKYVSVDALGPSIQKAGDVLAVGDVVAVEAVKTTGADSQAPRQNAGKLPAYALRQIPAIQGAAVALDPHTGRVLAMVGGYSQDLSEFNRATQAKRQPGSAFKPFVYLAGLDAGYTPSTIIIDGPIVIDQGPGLPMWKPENYSGQFYGPVPMRVGIELSRNLMTVRLAQNVGIEKVASLAERFGITDHMPRYLSQSLGAGETTLMKLASAYGMLANGGKKIEPILIDRVQSKEGKNVLVADRRPCKECSRVDFKDGDPPAPPDAREQIGDPISVFQLVTMMEGVIQRGTGARIAELGKTLAGKTGTTNDSVDAWFIGFSPDLVFGVYVGFDQPATLGAKETGASAAVPIFKDFMAEALKDRPDAPFRIPDGVRLVRINPATGQPARAGEKSILEAYRADRPMGSGPSIFEGVSAPDD